MSVLWLLLLLLLLLVVLLFLFLLLLLLCHFFCIALLLVSGDVPDNVADVFRCLAEVHGTPGSRRAI